MNYLKEINSQNRTCCYFGDIIRIEDFDFDSILLNETSSGNILIQDILYKTFIGAKPLRNGFDKIDGLIRVYDKTRYLVLFGVEKYDFIYNRIRYLIGLKSDITYVSIIIIQQSKLINLILCFQKKH